MIKAFFVGVAVLIILSAITGAPAAIAHTGHANTSAQGSPEDMHW